MSARADGAKGIIYMMGKRYTKIEDDSPDSYLQFRNDEYSRFLFTYRKNFEQIHTTGKTSDRGWGCMLRTSQMMFGEALSRCFLGRDYRVPKDHTEETPRALWIIRLFMDIPNRPFSLQRISTRGQKYDKPIGSWFGPSNAAYVLRDLLRAFNSPYLPFRIVTMSNGSIYSRSLEHVARRQPSASPPNDQVFQDIHFPYFACPPVPAYTPPAGQPTPIMDKIFQRQLMRRSSSATTPPFSMELADAAPSSSTPSGDSSSSPSTVPSTETEDSPESSSDIFYPTLLLVTAVLGKDKPAPECIAPVRYMLSLPWSVGFIGGKPNSSYWFYATREDYVYYANPHQTQETVKDPDLTQPFSTASYHGGSMHQKMKILKLDPCVCFGFLFQTEADWKDFKKEMKEYAPQNTLFTIEDKRPAYVAKDNGEYDP